MYKMVWRIQKMAYMWTLPSRRQYHDCVRNSEKYRPLGSNSVGRSGEGCVVLVLWANTGLGLPHHLFRCGWSTEIHS